MRTFCTFIFLMSILTCAAQKNTLDSYVPTGFEAMAKLERLPVMYPPGTKKNRCITYDATGGNGFGLFLSMFKKYVDEKGEIVFFDAYGPGCLYREQMNIWINNGVGAKNKSIRIKYYFDDETTPRIDVPVFEYFNGEHSPVAEPFAFRQKSQFGVIYYPFAFEKRLRITLSDTLLTRMVKDNLEASCNWFQFDYLTYPAGTKVKSWNPAMSEYEATVRKQWDNTGQNPKSTAGDRVAEKNISLRPGEQAVLFDQKGDGSITAIQLSLDPFTAETFYNTSIRIQWDDMSLPAVDMPVSYFFGGGGVKDNHWDDTFASLLHGYDSKTRTGYSYWPMPFWKRATVSIVNNSNENISNLTGKISWKPSSVIKYPQKETGYFMMKLTRDTSTGGLTRKDFTRPYAGAFFEKGHGHVLAVNMWSGNFYEDGDEFTYVDGSSTPQIHGDGTEDDFNQGWAGARYQKAIWGALNNGVKGAYRIHLNEPYIYYDQIDMRFEYTNSVYQGESPRKRQGTDNSIIETEFVVWYYQTPFGPAMQQTDHIDVGNAQSEQAHAYRVEGQTGDNTLTQGYDSYESSDSYHIVTDNGRSFNQYCEFDINLSKDNRGVRLRERINRTGNGIQTASIYVDGKKLPIPWYITTYSDQPNIKNRSFDGWFDSEYEIPSDFTKGKKKVRVRVEHVQSIKNELNSYYYWVFCYQ
jgi:hypothetical protein